MIKKLEIHTPFIKYSPCYGAAFSIIDITKDNLAWFFNNFSYFFIQKDNSKINNEWISAELNAFDFRQNGFSSYHNYWGIKTQIISRDFFFKYFGDIISFCKDMILNENYIFMFINAKYIKEYNISADYVHPIFISGFDDEKKVFYASDYFSYIYKTVSVPFGELKDGFFYAKEEYFLHEDYLHGITLYQKGSYRNQEYSSQERTENAIFESISWAINPTNFKGQLIPSLYQVFGGIYAQRCLCQYLYNKTRSLLCESQHKLLAILVEHKKVMNLGIDYLAKNSRISNKNKEEFCKIYEKYRQLLFRYLYIRQKYGGDNSQNLISEKPYDLIVKLDELTRCEEMFYMEIIKCQN